MSTVSDLVALMRRLTQAQGLTFMYGELWELNAGTEREYPIVLLEPLDSTYQDKNYIETYTCRLWVVDQELVTDDIAREDREATLRGYGKTLVLALRAAWLTTMQLASAQVAFRSYVGTAGVDNLVAVRLELTMLVHDCDA